MGHMNRLAIIATVALLLPGLLPASSGGSEGDEGAVAVLFDFGDGRWEWAYVAIPEPANAWCATIDAAELYDFEIEYSFSQYGVFLESVDGVRPPQDFSKYWSIWTWNDDAIEWESSLKGAIEIAVEDWTSVAWKFVALGDPAPSATPITREPWTAFRGGRAVNGMAGPSGPTVGGVLWAMNLGDGPIDSTLVVAEGKVFGVTAGVYDWNLFEFERLPTVFALDTRSGELLWERAFMGAGGFEIGSPAYAGGVLYASISSRSVMALDATDGSLLWETEVDDLGLSSSPTVVGGRVIIGTGSGKLVALRTADGGINWTANVSGGVYLAAPAVHNDVVYIGTDNATFHAFHLDNGTEVWTVYMPGRVRGTPLVVDDRIYTISAIYSGLSATDGFLHALDLDGTELWNVTIGPTGSSPAIKGDLVLIGSRSGLWAVRTDGTVAWRYQDAGPVSASPAVTNDLIYIMSNANDTENGIHTSVVALHQDGTVKWSRELLPHNWALSSVSVADRWVYTATDEGWVYALGDTPTIMDFEFETSGLLMNLASNSTAVGVNITSYQWIIEELGVHLDGIDASYEFEAGGVYNVTHIVVDEYDRQFEITYQVEVLERVEPPVEGSELDVGVALAVAVMGMVVVVLVAVVASRWR